MNRPPPFRPATGRGRLLGAAALGVLAASAYAAWRVRRVESEHPPAGRFVEVDGVRLHWTEHGAGEPLVLLHGNATSGLELELSGLVDVAARRWRVLVFDRPGFGHSDRPRDGRVWDPHAQAALLHGALTRIGVSGAVVLGHSWGALVALALALDHPASVRALVLGSGYLYPEPRLDARLASLPALPVVGDVYRHTVGALQFRASWPVMAKLMFAPARVTEGFRRFPAWMAARPSQLRASAEEGAMMPEATARLAARYAELRMPVVLVAGRDDRIVDTDAHSARFHRERPDSRLHVVEGAGHMVHHVAPRRVVEAIDAAAALSSDGIPALLRAPAALPGAGADVLH
ncbi:MAG TPA: alpha/beta hydrolase [Burkholderiaceae bacterium]|nr:alpha/beta hydrolase [Burkholderiaceae bacterium]